MMTKVELRQTRFHQPFSVFQMETYRSLSNDQSWDDSNEVRRKNNEHKLSELS
jgi:hypothetical protein